MGVLYLAGTGLASQARAEPPGPRQPLLILPVSGPEAAAAAMEAELSRALSKHLGEGSVTGISELNLLLTAEKTKDLLSCDDVSCMRDVLGALGAGWALGVTLVKGDPLSEVLLIVRDLHDASRVFRIERRAPSLMPARLQGLAEDLAGALMSITGWEPSESTDPAPEARGGTLDIHTDPVGARLFLNHEEIGRAPLTISGLAGGEYRLHAGARGYKTRKQKLELEAGAHHRLRVELSPLRDWQAGIFFGVAVHELRLRDAPGYAGSFGLLGVGAWYGREVWGPVQVGGLIGYSHASIQRSSDDANTETLVHRRGMMLGVHASAGIHLGVRSFLTVGEALAQESQQQQVEQALATLEEKSTDFGLASVRLRAKLLYETQGFVSSEIGVEVGFVSVFHMEFGWRRVLWHAASPFHDVDRIAPNAAFGRMIVGYSTWHASPEK